MTNNQMVHTSFSIEPTIRNAGGSNQYFGWAGGNGSFCYPSTPSLRWAELPAMSGKLST